MVVSFLRSDSSIPAETNPCTGLRSIRPGILADPASLADELTAHNAVSMNFLTELLDLCPGFPVQRLGLLPFLIREADLMLLLIVPDESLPGLRCRRSQPQFHAEPPDESRIKFIGRIRGCDDDGIFYIFICTKKAKFCNCY